MDDYLRNYILLAVLGFILEARCDWRMMPPTWAIDGDRPIYPHTPYVRDGDSKVGTSEKWEAEEIF